MNEHKLPHQGNDGQAASENCYQGQTGPMHPFSGKGRICLLSIPYGWSGMEPGKFLGLDEWLREKGTYDTLIAILQHDVL